MSSVRRRMPVVEWSIMVPVEIAAQVELAAADPVYGKPKYGFRSQLITHLLTEWITKQKLAATAAKETPPQSGGKEAI